MFDKGDRVNTTMGPGTVVYRRLTEFGEVSAYSVLLDSKKEESEKPPFKTYTGTIFAEFNVVPFGESALP